MYAVIDRASRNVLGEFGTYVEAESCLLEFVGAHPPAAGEVEIVGPQGARKTVARAKLERAASDAAVAAIPA